MQPTITGAQIIGSAESARGPETFRTRDPRTGEPTPWAFHEAGETEIDTAANLAKSAFPAFRALPGERRAAFLRAIADSLDADADALVAVYTMESGLPEGRARGELGRTTNQLRAFAALVASGSWQQARIDTALPNRKPVPRPDLRKCLFPIGPVAVFGASNFPFAFSTAGGDTASALAVGCPVVVKGHPLHAGTGEAVARHIQRAAKETGMPDGVFAHLQGSGNALGEALVKHPAIKAVGFTGSRKGGLSLFQMGQQRPEPIPVFAEMGSINPVVVLPSATDPGLGWPAAYARSVTLGTGQFCTNPGLILGIAGPAWDSFTTALSAEISKVPAGCMLHRGMADHFRELRKEFLSHPGVEAVEAPKEEGGDALVAGTVARVKGADFCKSPALQQEVFGPFTLVVACADGEELLRAVHLLEGQLTASILGEPAELGAYPGLLEALRDKVGRLLFNGVPTGVEVCPSMQHGGPYPATTDARFTSVGTDAIYRWLKPLTFQNAPREVLPPALQDHNPLGIWRTVNGTITQKSIDP